MKLSERKTKMMPRHARAYAYAVAAGGVGTLACAATLWTSQSPIRFFACLFLALLASTFKVKLPGMESCISPSFIPLLFAVGTMSWQESVVMAAAAGILQTLWRAVKRPLAIQILFNGANLALAMGAAFIVSDAVAGSRVLLRLAIAVMVFEALNTLSVSMIVTLMTGDRLKGIWQNCHLWTFPYHLCGAVLAGAWIQSDMVMGASVTVLGAVTLYMLSAFYRELVKFVAPRSEQSSI